MKEEGCQEIGLSGPYGRMEDMMKKVVKFGGSSLASARQFKKVGDIIRSDKSRRYVVPSAPGKRNDKDEKVTDLLYQCYDAASTGASYKKILEKIKKRYEEIIDGLNELILDRESFIEKDDPDSIFVHDAEVLREAVKILQAVESKEKEQIMSKDEFRQWIYDNYNVPGDNCTLAPAMLDGILDYAEGMEPEEQYSFLCTMFPSLPESILRRVEY